MTIRVNLCCVLFALMTVGLDLNSQEIQVNAEVKGHEGNELPVEVVILDSIGNFLAGDQFSDGRISLRIRYKGTGNITISSFGYKNFQKPLHIEDENINLNTIFLVSDTNLLNEVSVIARKPIFEKTNEGTRVNIENTILSKSMNSQELLGRLPGVIINNNKVNVFGRGEAIIILNGKETSLESYKSLPPSDIRNIEIISNPDSKYDAKAKAVILVNLKKHVEQGASINIVDAITVGFIKDKPLEDYVVNAPNITLNLRKKTWNFSAYYANEFGTSWAENNFTTIVKTQQGDFRKLGYYTEDNHSKAVHNYRIGISRELNSKENISIQYDGISHYFGLDVRQDGRYGIETQSEFLINMMNDASTRLKNHSANLNYNKILCKETNTLFVGFQWNKFTNRLLDRITERISNQNYQSINNRINNGLNTIYLYTGQMDYSHALKKGKIDAGCKLAYNSNEGQIRFSSKEELDTEYKEIGAFGNSTLYREWVPALYSLYKFQGKKLNIQIGARAEYTHALGVSRKYDSTLIEASYLNLFPSLKCIYSLTDKMKIAGSYSYRINRPLYQDLDPFLWYLDSLTSIQGNSRLIPELIHQSELKLHYNNLSLRYNFTVANKSITSVMRQGNQGVNSVVFTKDNINQRITNSFAIDYPIEIGNYSSFTTTALNYYQFKDTRPEYSALSGSPQFYFYTYHSYKFTNIFTVDLTSEFYSKSYDGFTRRKPYYYTSIGISRNFLKNENLSISILWNDIFRSALWAGKFDVNTYSNEYQQRFTLNYLRLNIGYAIQSKTKFNYNNKNVNESEYNRIKK